jgi:peptidoglycan-N-acetylglucosamine deacetylase
MTRRRRLGLWSLAILSALAIALALYQVSKARCFALTGDLVCRVETERRLIALSFDDGPTEHGVDWVLPILSRHQARATFFLIGAEVEARPALVRRLLAQGHEVGNHSFSHDRMVARLPGFSDEEIARTDSALRRAGVPVPVLFRPPYGRKLIGLPRAVERNGYRMIMWDVEDPTHATTPQDYAEAVLSEVRPGSIILMHVMYRANRLAREALPLIVHGLRARGYRIVTVGELLRLRS